MNAGASPPTSEGTWLRTLNRVKQSRLLTGPLEEWGQQEVRQASAVLDFLWPSSLDSRHCRDTPALRFFSYLLPLGLSVSPCTWPRLVVVVEAEVSPAGGSRVGEERHPDSVSHPDAQHPPVNSSASHQWKRSAASCLGNSANSYPQSSPAVADN